MVWIVVVWLFWGFVLFFLVGGDVVFVLLWVFFKAELLLSCQQLSGSCSSSAVTVEKLYTLVCRNPGFAKWCVPLQ